MLDQIMKRQKEFSSNFVAFEELTADDQRKLIRDYAFNVVEEAVEIAREAGIKQHKPVAVFDVEKAKYEAVDCFKYVLNLCLVMGMSSDELTRMFYEKTAKVERDYNDRV